MILKGQVFYKIIVLMPLIVVILVVFRFLHLKIHDFIQSRCKELNVNYDYTSKNQI